MLRMAQKTYTILVTITEGNDEFWEEISGKSGTDEVVAIVKDALEDRGFSENCDVRLWKFELA